MTDDGGTRTVQLRRYRIAAGELDAFTEWFRSRLLPARVAFGFALEFAVRVPDTSDFVWAVSAQGDRDAFLALDGAWTSSPERAAAFEGVPNRVLESTLQLVEPVG